MELEQAICAILDAELIPALGCTEPMAFGLCAAAARSQTTGEIQEILCEASPAMIKGVQYVTIPRSGGRSGGKMACALGALAGRMEDGMEVFQPSREKLFQVKIQLVPVLQDAVAQPCGQRRVPG